MKKSENPKISIIVPIYNTERYLPHCIDSILRQSFRDFELLLIDDGSKDGSGAICDEYAVNDERVKVYHQENQGVSVARNVGLEHAKGEWIYFVDADDEVLPEGIEALIKTANGYDSVFGSFEKVHSKGERIYHTTIGSDKVMPRSECIKTLYGKSKTLVGMWRWLWVRLFRNDIIKKYKIRFDTNISYNEDGLFITEYICHSKTPIYYVDTLVYRYYESETSVMESTKNSFNPKLLTSYKSFVKMYHSIAACSDFSPAIIRIAKEGIIWRYTMIKQQMEQHNAIDADVLREYRKIYRKECGIFFVVMYYIKNYLRRSVNYILKKIHISYRIS